MSTHEVFCKKLQKRWSNQNEWTSISAYCPIVNFAFCITPVWGQKFDGFCILMFLRLMQKNERIRHGNARRSRYLNLNWTELCRVPHSTEDGQLQFQNPSPPLSSLLYDVSQRRYEFSQKSNRTPTKWQLPISFFLLRECITASEANAERIICVPTWRTEL